ncbi:hypothetical protein OB905_05610 [Halobacteria archaeon AArc-dxtr1]|nr:hypothetical protein [Halobacteria archaeon AArc-dxtr1]
MFEQHFLDGVPWDETDCYRNRIEQLKRGESVPELDGPEQTVEAYESYLAYWDDVAQHIRDDGYRSQRELRASQDFAARVPTALGEIEVLIGRDGRLICNAGKHRLTLAKLLGLDSVPVRIAVRHEHWQRVRETISRADNSADLPEEAKTQLSHPDLADLHSAA